MTTRRLSAAEEEYLSSIAFYIAESPRAAERFAAEVEEAIAEVLLAPERYPIYEANIRRKVLKTFPFSLYYFAEKEELVIVAIMHNNSRPKYWRSRL
jgi:plasmid stabilization system protein ParE